MRESIEGHSKNPAYPEQTGKLLRAIPLLGENVGKECSEFCNPQSRDHHQRLVGRRLKALEVFSQLMGGKMRFY